MTELWKMTLAEWFQTMVTSTGPGPVKYGFVLQEGAEPKWFTFVAFCRKRMRSAHKKAVKSAAIAGLPVPEATQKDWPEFFPRFKVGDLLTNKYLKRFGTMNLTIEPGAKWTVVRVETIEPGKTWEYSVVCQGVKAWFRSNKVRPLTPSEMSR